MLVAEGPLPVYGAGRNANSQDLLHQNMLANESAKQHKGPLEALPAESDRQTVSQRDYQSQT